MLLLEEGELCVCELTYALNEIQPKVSRHLASLRDAQVVMDKRAGQWVYYRLNPALPAWATGVLKSTRQGMEGDKRFITIMHKLRRMPNRPENRACA